MRLFWSTYKRRLLIILAVLGPGLITAFADNDAGGVATYSVAAAKFGYSMLTTMIPITLVLFVTQEIGSRIAVVSGKGLADHIRERFGIKISLVVFTLLFFVNFAVILQDVGGFKAAFQLFHINIYIFLPISIGLLFLFIVKSSYKRIERFFLVLILFYLTYFISAIQSKPDWHLVAKALVVPVGHISFAYLYTAIAVLGTTVTAWGQFFINSYVKDKKLTVDKLKYNQVEISIGAVLTNLFTLFMMVAVTATIWIHHITINDAADATLAIQPFAGVLASAMFAIGLFVAGLIGTVIVPLATAYAFSEFFGFEGSLDTTFAKSKLFYLMFIFQVGLGTIVTLLPQVSLFKITLYADFLNGIFLPVIFIFLYKIGNNKEIMGDHVNTKLQNILLIGSGVIITVGAIVGGFGTLLGL